MSMPWCTHLNERVTKPLQVVQVPLHVGAVRSNLTSTPTPVADLVRLPHPRYSVAVHEAAAIAVGAVLRALVVDGFYAERDLADALRLAAVAVTELPNSMVLTFPSSLTRLLGPAGM